MNVDQTCPTLVMTECLLIYLKPEHSSGIVQWCSTFWKEAPFVGLLNYEMINPDDMFGRKMVDNLRDRGCELLGIDHFPSLEAQKARLQECLGVAGPEGS
mmetsp:Transcript_32100/g.49086  ORF Transcript_32100/g.49086 Transcript_32100/m.49086 type:complete len:100 (+) Transcript_32100:556-855(+)